MKVTKDNLIQITIKEYIKHFGLRLDGDFLYKDDICILDCGESNKELELFSFLRGLSAVIDNKGLFNKELKGGLK